MGRRMPRGAARRRRSLRQGEGAALVSTTRRYMSGEAARGSVERELVSAWWRGNVRVQNGRGGGGGAPVRRAYWTGLQAGGWAQGSVPVMAAKTKIRVASVVGASGRERETAAKWRASSESQRRISACVSWARSGERQSAVTVG
jgi:hypothetical protein